MSPSPGRWNAPSSPPGASWRTSSRFPTTPRSIARRLGKVGVWTFAFDHQPIATIRVAAQRLEALGYGALWFPESLIGREALTTAAIVLEATERMLVGPGVARASNRSPHAMLAGQGVPS